MKSSHGRMVFVDTGRAYLIVVTECEIDIGPVGIEIQSASRRIGQLCRVQI
jgi:predicted regulator of Ras-like GTPase activity (Roadblock/LC7/MglB family)